MAQELHQDRMTAMSELLQGLTPLEQITVLTRLLQQAELTISQLKAHHHTMLEQAIREYVGIFCIDKLMSYGGMLQFVFSKFERTFPQDYPQMKTDVDTFVHYWYQKLYTLEQQGQQWNWIKGEAEPNPLAKKR